MAEVKQALEQTPALVTALLPFGVLKTPFHYTLHDATGASIVIEFANGQQNVIDNPIGVMTNGPEFQWHLTNLNNYTFLSNKDQSRLTIKGVQLHHICQRGPRDKLVSPALAVRTQLPEGVPVAAESVVVDHP